MGHPDFGVVGVDHGLPDPLRVLNDPGSLERRDRDVVLSGDIEPERRHVVVVHDGVVGVHEPLQGLQDLGRAFLKVRRRIDLIMMTSARHGLD